MNEMSIADQKKIDIRMKRVKEDDTRMISENNRNEKDARNGMSDLKSLQEKMRDLLQKEDILKQDLEDAKQKLYNLNTGDNTSGRYEDRNNNEENFTSLNNNATNGHNGYWSKG